MFLETGKSKMEGSHQWRGQLLNVSRAGRHHLMGGEVKRECTAEQVLGRQEVHEGARLLYDSLTLAGQH